MLAAKDLRLVSPATARTGGSQVETLMELWNERERKNKTFSDFEAALVRLGRDYCRRRWQVCPMREYCGRRGLRQQDDGQRPMGRTRIETYILREGDCRLHLIC
jgi:hypothetical protein